MEDNILYLVDTTLREGAQAPGVQYDEKKSIEIAICLNSLGVDTIEIGHACEKDIKRIKAVVALNLKANILTHARANKSDIDIAHAAGVSWVGIFLGVNDQVRKYQLNNRSENEVFMMIKESVSYAKKLGLKVRYSIEDASRTDTELLLKAYKHAIDAGADRICFADSVGAIEPLEMSNTIAQIKSEFPDTPIEVHCHNDRGLALANALYGGADWISCSINGIGERAGITDTLALIGNLALKSPHKKYKTKLLSKASILVNALTRSSVIDRQPMVGKNVFTHTADLHKKAVKNNTRQYSLLHAEEFGKKNILEYDSLPLNLSDFVLKPDIISSTELKYHRHGTGDRYVMLDDRFVSDARLYSIVRIIDTDGKNITSHVDAHRHNVDSLFLFVSSDKNMEGLCVEVALEDEVFEVNSPASVFIPAGVEHSYKIISGKGLFINHVLSGSYNDSLLEKDF